MCGKSCRRCRLFSAPVRALKQLSILYSTEGRESSMISLVRMLQHLTVEFLKVVHYSVSWCDKVVPVSITNARSMPTARVSDSGIWCPLATRLWRYLRRLLFRCCDGLSWSCCQNLPCKQWHGHGCSMPQSLPCWLWVHLFPSSITFFSFCCIKSHLTFLMLALNALWYSIVVCRSLREWAIVQMQIMHSPCSSTYGGPRMLWHMSTLLNP